MQGLSIDRVSKQYNGEEIVSDITIEVAPGEIACLFGISGSGKSTIFHIASGMVLPDSGGVHLNGEEITGVLGRVSYMQQKDLLLPHKKVLDNAALPLIINGTPKVKARETAASYFHRFGLSGSENKYPSQLSGGMRQRAALLRTYLSKGGAILLDEPFSALDALTRASLQDWYLGVAEEIELPTLFVTHDPEEAVLLSDKVFILSGKPGKIAGVVEINAPRKDRRAFAASPEGMEFKRRILEMI